MTKLPSCLNVMAWSCLFSSTFNITGLLLYIADNIDICGLTTTLPQKVSGNLCQTIRMKVSATQGLCRYWFSIFSVKTTGSCFTKGMTQLVHDCKDSWSHESKGLKGDYVRSVITPIGFIGQASGVNVL